ncbi:hypothetical protein P5663_06970 [Priestia flexa]|uniref:hypothetical protein n=1 Tax=Priestia flexa TaxID=86664 RepID=UPI00240D8866|nr:hypothetical protein [Priestia flexa]WEZ09577.1 hypothetical protein P5663_06970 [Priestia flexa]
MSVKIEGLDKLLKSLDYKLGIANLNKIIDRALIKGANVFVSQLKLEFESFKDTGASIDEITISQPMIVDGIRTVKIHWRGERGRYRIIHLNEWGTVKNPNPKGKGAIARVMRNATKAYQNVIKQELGRGLS